MKKLNLLYCLAAIATIFAFSSSVNARDFNEEEVINGRVELKEGLLTDKNAYVKSKQGYVKSKQGYAKSKQGYAKSKQVRDGFKEKKPKLVEKKNQKRMKNSPIKKHPKIIREH